MKFIPKKFFLLLFFLCSVVSLFSQQNEKISLTIHITGIASNNGSILVALYDKEGDFLKNELRGTMSKIDMNKATVVFRGLQPGVYAVTLFHDENDNKKLDTNFFGIPKENYGFSNKAKGFFGPPKFENAKFSLSKNTIIQIGLD